MAFGFQPLRNEYAIFSFEFIKVCLHRLWEISTTHSIKSRIAIKFPTPYEWWSTALLGKKKRQMPAVYPGGGGWCLDLLLFKVNLDQASIILFPWNWAGDDNS